jgi:hypothetical protein
VREHLRLGIHSQHQRVVDSKLVSLVGLGVIGVSDDVGCCWLCGSQAAVLTTAAAAAVVCLQVPAGVTGR